MLVAQGWVDLALESILQPAQCVTVVPPWFTVYNRRQAHHAPPIQRAVHGIGWQSWHAAGICSQHLPR